MNSTHRTGAPLPGDPVPPDAVPIMPPCSFCGAERPPEPPVAGQGYPIWRCGCGAVGCGAWLHDTDEACDQLLRLLGISGTVCEPREPFAGTPMIQMQRKDSNRSLALLGEMLRQNGYELRIIAGRIPAASWVACMKGLGFGIGCGGAETVDMGVYWARRMGIAG